MRELGRRVGSVLGSLPGEAGDAARSGRFGRTPDGRAPLWLRLPTWLNEAWQEEPTDDVRDRGLPDLLWGQYALFLYIRLQDDLLDQHRDDLRLLFVADRFLLESLESFQRFPELDGEFLVFYRRCLRETVDGILAVRSLESEAGRFTAEHLDLHAQVSAIFKVGAVAVCRLHGRVREVPWVSQLLDRLAVFGQIGDDLQDLAPDLEVGRFTWAANVLMGAKGGEVIPPDERIRRLSGGLMRTERGEQLLAELRRLARLAAEGVPASAPRPVHDLARALHSQVGVLEQGMHEAKVRWVFGEAVAG